jgi:hypothetical protein
MNKREMLLAGIVASLILLLGIGYAVIQVKNAIDKKDTEITGLQEKIRQQELDVEYSQKDQEQIEAYRAKALPADVAEAQTLYKDWLMDCAKEIGFHDPQVDPIATRSKSKAYEAFAYSVTGRGDLEQAIEFLHRFYSVDCLHRIFHLSANRIADTKQHDLTISVEALSLKDATSTDQLPVGQSNRLAYGDGDLDTYRKKILYRNFFGPPNNEPTMESIGEITAYAGRTVEIAVRGSDPDKLDKVSYHIDGDGVPSDLSDNESGRFEWTATKLGEHEVEITATDNGWPPKSVSQTVTIKVTEAEDEQVEVADLPSFEKAKFAYVTGITEVDGRKETWISLRTEGKMLKLKEGDEFVVDEVTVTVKRISEKTVELEAEVLKKRLLVSLGQNLAEGNSLPSEEG